MPVDLSEAKRIELIETCVNTCKSLTESYTQYQLKIRGEPLSSQSPALKSAEYASRKYGPGGDWSVDFAHRITVRTLIYLAGAQQYIEAMRSLAHHQPYGLGLAPLARSSAEICGKICWLLDRRLPLKEGMRRRAARLLLDEADDAKRRMTLMVQLGHPDRAKAGDDYRTARDAISRPGYFYGSEIDASRKDGKLVVCGESLPSPTDLIRIAEDVLKTDPMVATGVYGYLSSMAHPTLFAFIETFPLIANDDDAVLPYLAARPDAIFTAKLVSYGALSFYNGWRIIASWLGTDFSEADSFRDLHALLNRQIAQHTESV